MRVSVSIRWDDQSRPLTPGLLTDRHAASSYGAPVVVARTSATDATLIPWGPGDLAAAGGAVLVVDDPVGAARAEMAGYRVAAASCGKGEA